MKMTEATFSYHPSPSTEQKAQHAAVEKAFTATLRVIQENTPDGRYRSIAITQLELSGAAAVKSIYHENDGGFRPGSHSTVTGRIGETE
jgi:hypothetical protein